MHQEAPLRRHSLLVPPLPLDKFEDQGFNKALMNDTEVKWKGKIIL